MSRGYVQFVEAREVPVRGARGGVLLGGGGQVCDGIALQVQVREGRGMAQATDRGQGIVVGIHHLQYTAQGEEGEGRVKARTGTKLSPFHPRQGSPSI